jgi:hypothetical protein
MRGWKGKLMTLAVLGWVAAGCDTGTGVNLLQVRSPGSDMTLTVTGGTTPTYSWSGGRARSLAVRAASGEIFWQIEALDLSTGFSAPVQHGVVPAGARVVVAARALTPGVLHTALVVGVSGSQGSRAFTPQSIAAP